MERDEVVRELTAYVVNRILQGDARGLDEHTPIIEWGLLNSLELMRLLSFIHQRFGVRLAPNAAVSRSFGSLGAVADLVVSTLAAEKHGDAR